MIGIGAFATLEVFDVALIIPLEPHRLRVSLEGKNVSGDAIEEPAIVSDHDRAAGEIDQRFLERAQCIDIEIVGWLVEQEQVAARLQKLGEMQTVPLTAGKVTHFLLLIGALEVELRQIRARLHLTLADHVMSLPSLTSL